MRNVVLILLALLHWLAAGCAGLVDFQPTEASRLLGVSEHPPQAVPDSLRVVSYNIQYGEKTDQAVEDLQARPHLREADILLLQEMTDKGTVAVARALGLNYVYFPASIHPHHGKPFGNAVLSPWPIIASRLLVLPHPHPLSGDRRIATCADLDLGGRKVRAVSVHTATLVLEQEKRMAQAQAVVDSLANVPGPLVIGGDFNTVTPYEVDLLRRIFRRADLHPVRLPPGSTIKGWKSGVLAEETVLDHLFVRNLGPGEAGVSRQAAASDHFPIWAVLAWNEDPVQK